MMKEPVLFSVLDISLRLIAIENVFSLYYLYSIRIGALFAKQYLHRILSCMAVRNNNFKGNLPMKYAVSVWIHGVHVSYTERKENPLKIKSFTSTSRNVIRERKVEEK